MRITAKGQQAVTAMIDVALHQKFGPVALTAISRRKKISVSYLEQMFASLRRHGLVTSTRGPGGGYVIARCAQTIAVADIVLAVDRGNAVALNGGVHGSQSDGERCLTPELWNALGQRVFEFLASVHLQSLIDDEIAGGAPMVDMRPINRRRRAVRADVPVLPRGPNSVFDLERLTVV